MLLGGDGADFLFGMSGADTLYGGSGFDNALAIGTELPDNFAVTAQGVFGAGIKVLPQTVEQLEVDALEADDDFFVLGTAPGMATKLIGGLGSDLFDVAGDVIDTIVSDGALYPAVPHLLGVLQGPLEIEGGSVGERALQKAVMLPGERDR